MKQYTLFFALLLFGTTTAMAGGPWTQLKGKGYLKLSEWWLIFDQHYTDTGLTDPNVTTGIFNTAIYAEYGLSNRLTGIVYAPLFSRNYMNNLVSATTGDVLVKGEALNSVGDIDLALKYGLTKRGSRFPVAATLLLGIPTGKTGGGELGNLQTGDGEFNQMLQLDAGTSFQLGKKIPSYVSANVAFNNRSNGFSEEVRYGVEYGLALLKQKLWLIGRLNVVESLKNGDTAETITSTSIFANNTEYKSFGIEANYYVSPKVGVSVGFASAFEGEIIAAAPSYSVGVFFDMSK